MLKIKKKKKFCEVGTDLFLCEIAKWHFFLSFKNILIHDFLTFFISIAGSVNLRRVWKICWRIQTNFDIYLVTL